jgi:hypothetical protein
MPHQKNEQNLLKKLLLFSIIVCSIFYSCKKLDVSYPGLQNQTLNFKENFFATKTNVNKEVAALIEKLKMENGRTDFVNKLPNDCGLPLWDKIQIMQTNTSSLGQREADSSVIELDDATLIIPLSISNSALSSIIIAKPLDTGYSIECKTTNYSLYNLCHKSVADSSKAENELTLFLFMEKLCFGTTKFYNIPSHLFSKVTGTNTMGKSVTIGNSETGSNFIQTICIEIEHCVGCSGTCDRCPICLEIRCWTGGEPGGGRGGGTGGGGGNPPGGGGGGGGTTGGGGCPWYGCGNPPPPPVDTIFNPCQTKAKVTALANNTAFKGMLQFLKDKANDTTDHTEYGWLYNYTPTGGLIVDSRIGVTGKKGVDFTVNYKIDGFAHDHFVNSLSVFSPDDLWAISTAFLQNNINDSTTFTFPLVTAQGTQYMLMISNLSMFRRFAQKITAGSLIGQKIMYTSIWKIIETNTKTVNERQFLRYLKRNGGGSGLMLFRGNSTFTQWTAIGLDTNDNVIDLLICEE